MFFAVEIKDTVAIDCENSGRTFAETLLELEKHIRIKYVDRVMPGQGLCVWCIGILHVDPRPIIGPNDGRPCYDAKFQAVMYRPLKYSIIMGRISGSDKNGLRISTGFFQDIKVPAHLLQADSTFDEDQQLWFWNTSSTDELGMSKDLQLCYALNHVVRAQTEEVIYSKDEADMDALSNNRRDTLEASKTPVVPMMVIASMLGDGLGLVDWWS